MKNQGCEKFINKGSDFEMPKQENKQSEALLKPFQILKPDISGIIGHPVSSYTPKVYPIYEIGKIGAVSYVSE